MEKSSKLSRAPKLLVQTQHYAGKWRVSRNHERIVISVVGINDIRPVFYSITAENILASARYTKASTEHTKKGIAREKY